MTDRKSLLEKVDAMCEEVEIMKSRARDFGEEAEQLQKQSAYKLEQKDKLWANIRRRNSEIDKLIDRIRGRT